jgi:hypothetical protein
MQLNPRLLKDTLTAYAATAGTSDPLTGAGTSTRTLLVSQPCNLQEVRRIPDATLTNLSGVQASKRAYRCYTKWVDLSGAHEIAVNGVQYVLLKPIDVGGQHEILELQLGTAEGSA